MTCGDRIGGGPVLLDEPASWPVEVAILAEQLAEGLADTTMYTSDLDVAREDQAAVVQALLDSGRSVRIYHCTRLTGSECKDVLLQGLRPASQQLVLDRLERAVAERLLTQQERDLLVTEHMLQPHHETAVYRVDRIYGVVTRAAFLDPHGLWRLFAHWGGELIAFAHDGQPMLRRLASLGEPSVVVVDVPTGALESGFWAPDLAKVLVGVLLGLEEADGQVALTMDGDAALAVTAVWRPGDPQYDEYPSLPSS